ncbi:MAG TPA: LamG-like jellyroll fold domain-containing protein [Armatimonadota bacterium]
MNARSIGIALVLCGLWLASAARLRAVATVISEDLNTDRYDCMLTLLPAKNLVASHVVHLTLEQGPTRAGGIEVTLTKTSLRIVGDPPNIVGDVPASGIVPGTPYHLMLLRRGTSLGVLHDDTLIAQVTIPRGTGNRALLTADAGWTVQEARVQRLESVVFADNFMRAPGEPSPWATQSGAWALQTAWDEEPHGNSYSRIFMDHAQNPFAWTGKSTSEPALCTVGNPAWEDYTMTAAVRPADDGAVGVVVNMPTPQSGLLVRWSPANDTGALGNRLALCRLVNGKMTLLAEDAGGYVPGQWYQLSVVSSYETLHVTVDGKERLVLKAPTPRRGGVGLYAEGKTAAIFDDITVYGHTLKTELIDESRAARVNESFLDDRFGRMQQWSTGGYDWQPVAQPRGLRVHRKEFYGDNWLALTLQPTTQSTGQLVMVLNGDARGGVTGYRAVVQLNAGNPKPSYTLYQQETILATATGDSLTPWTDFSLRLCHVKNRLWLEVDGKTMLSANADALPGTHPAYLAQGALARTRDVVALGRNVLDYTFTDAPVDWLAGEGTWTATTRWACSPGWSFLGGWSRGDSVLWLKRRFTGDISFQAFFGVKMEYPREHDVYDTRYRDFALTICGDGLDPRQGYAAVLGAPDAQGTPNRRTVLLRNGVEVASVGINVPSTGRESPGHREWYALELRKHGATVEVWALNNLALTYTDPDPLAGGIPAIWTSNNGIVVARARLYFAGTPQPWSRPLVTIDAPGYPEWANIGQPVLLDLPHTWSATGQPVRLDVTPRAVPPADRQAVTTTGTRLTFAPTALGAHWYQVVASDGENRSPSFHLDLPAFNPALGRDDTHALVLYRFDEGSGNVVHDRSAVAPAADLRTTRPGTWLPGQGLRVLGAAPLQSGIIDKLLVLKKTHACTVELWASTISIYPMESNAGNTTTRWVGSLLTWEKNPYQRNLTVGHQGEFLTVCARSDSEADYDKPFATNGFRTGPQHWVVTWDGATTRTYMNGALLQTRDLPWRADDWLPGATLTLGNRSDGTRGYMGALYLAAVHDRCFTPADILRHYQAGPSAR